MVAEVTLQEPVGGLYEAKVQVIDAVSGTFGVRLEISNPGNKIPAGLRCSFQEVVSPPVKNGF